MPKVSIIDYGVGNLFSVLKACEFVGLNAEITSDMNRIIASDALILPGVGAFKDAMTNLNKLDLVDPIINFSKSGKPLMGVCLGMQLLLTESEEFGKTKGLGIIKGVCKKFPFQNNGNNLKVPQINWNTISPPYGGDKFEINTPLEEIKKDSYMYFVHSYYADLVSENEVLSNTKYGGIEYCSSIRKGNVFGFQFHPEKSGTDGLNIYKKLKELINNNESRK